MRSYLVEVYVPRSKGREAAAAAARERSAAEALSREGRQIRYVRTTFLPDDETCFHVFVAACPETVHEIARVAGLGIVRVVAVIEASRPRHPQGPAAP